MAKFSLASARINAGLTQKEAAKQLGVSNKTLNSWENYMAYPKINYVVKLCELYNISYDDINFLPNNSL